ncbi:MAG: hypothetical protein ACREQW_05410 [Candidatus Binatia bacterium]
MNLALFHEGFPRIQVKKIIFTREEFSHLPGGVKRQLWILTPARDVPRLRALGVVDTIKGGPAIRPGQISARGQRNLGHVPMPALNANLNRSGGMAFWRA